MFASTPLQQSSQQGTAMSDQSAGRIMFGVAAGLFAITTLQMLFQPLLNLPGISRDGVRGFLAVLWAPLLNGGLGSLIIALVWTVPIGYLALKHLGLRHTAVITAVSWVVGGLALWMKTPYHGYTGVYVLVTGLLGCAHCAQGLRRAQGRGHHGDLAVPALHRDAVLPDQLLRRGLRRAPWSPPPLPSPRRGCSPVGGSGFDPDAEPPGLT